MYELIKIQKHKQYGMVTDSRNMAKILSKRHDHILRDLDKIVTDPNLGALDEYYITGVSNMILPDAYIDIKGEKRRQYLLTKDGVMLYLFNIQGYNDIKIAYINKFNEMEKQIKHNLSQATETQISRILNNQQTEIQSLKDNYKSLESELQNISKKISIPEITPKQEYDIFYKINEARHWVNKQYVNINTFIQNTPNFTYTHIPSIIKQVYAKFLSEDNIDLKQIKQKYQETMDKTIGTITAISYESQLRELFEKHLIDVLEDRKYYTNMCLDKSSPFYKVDTLEEWKNIVDNLLCKELREQNIVRECNVLSKFYNILRDLETEHNISILLDIDGKYRFDLNYLYQFIFNSKYRNFFENKIAKENK